MWGYLKESVNKSTSGLMKDISERFVNDSNHHSQKHVQHPKTAMTNVVTPNSIPQFTLPPLLTYDSKPHANPCNDEAIENIEIAQTNRGQIENKKTVMIGNDIGSKSPIIYHPNFRYSNHKKPYDQLSQNQPGLTLHHLLSTKSGFSTLTESPNTKRKESLFLSPSPSYHLSDVLLQGEKSKCNSPAQSSSDSDISRNVSPRSSPSIERLRNKRLLGKSGFDSDSTSSCPSTPLQSPKERRKKLSSILMNEKANNQNGNSSKKNEKNHSDNDVRRHNSASSVSRYGVALSLDSSTESKSRLHMIVTYLVAQQKLNVSILEADNFVVGRAVYLKVSLLPGNHGSHRTDILKTSTRKVDIRERFSFHQVKEDDISLMSLEVSCKEKPGRLRHANSIGKCTLTLCEIDVTTSNDLWLELKPPEIEEAPHIQLSLCYHAMLGFVTIEVIAVRNVPKGGMGRYQDCYVVLAKEPPDEKSSKKQTKLSHRTKDPVFHESFIFSMPHDELVIVATLFCKDKVKGHWSSCGEVKLGQGVETWSGQAQWSQALDREGQPVTFWHLLRS